MMMKVRIFIAIIILSFSFSVNAEVLLELDCDSKNIADNGNVTCEGYLSYEQVSINDIELEYDTKLNVEFKGADGFTVSQKDGKVFIHTDEALYDEIMNSTKLFDVSISSNGNSSEEELILKNIIINKNSEEKIDDVKEIFSIDLPDKQETLDDNCFLERITIDDKLINNFNKEQLEYKDIYVDSEKIFIDAVRSSDKSSASGLGEVIVNPGESIVRDITVIAQNGDVKVYKLYITSSLLKEEIKSSNNNIKLIELYHGNNKINFNFDNRKSNFNIQVDDEIEDITIKAELEDSKAIFVNNYGPRKEKLKYGNNDVLLKVKSENNDVKVYDIIITRKDERSTDNTLSSLLINNKEILLADEVYKYEITLPHDVDKTNIKTIANDEKATIEYEDIILADGDNNISIKVTAENGKEQEYEVNVIREEEIVLEKIEIIGYDFDFSKDKHNYNLKITEETDELDIKTIPNDIDYEVLNNKKLHNGSIITIRVNDSLGEHEYTINIEKNSVMLSVICYVVFGIGVVSLILAVVHVKKRK